MINLWDEAIEWLAEWFLRIILSAVLVGVPIVIAFAVYEMASR